MKVFELETLTKAKVENYFKSNYGMEIKTKSGTHYHIVKSKKGYHCFAWFTWSERKLTKAMKAVFC